MSINIKDDDFIELATQIKTSLDAHNVPVQEHASLITQVVFNFAVFLDKKLNTNHHEFIETKLDEYLFEIVEDSPNTLIASVNLVFGKGRKRDFEIRKGNLLHRESIISLMEFATGIRKLTEVDSEVDPLILTERFEKMLEIREGLLEIEFQPDEDWGTNKWLTLPFHENQFGKFKCTIDGVTDCIYKVTEQWS